MVKRILGKNGLTVSAIGLGCMTIGSAGAEITIADLIPRLDDPVIDVREAAVASLSAGKAPRVNEGSCAACDHERDAEARIVGLVADFLDEEEMREGMEGSQGLCLPHLAAVLARRKDAPAWFIELHRRRQAEFLALMVRYIDSFKLSTEERRAALSFEEEMAWKRIAPLATVEGGWARSCGKR